MPVTIQLPDDLLKETETVAAATHHEVNEIVEQALRDWLARRRAVLPVRLITYGQGGLLPEVNLDDSASLLAIMDAADDPA
ncbi:MAG TPA: ribbon-helix-helix protein, CopG family [Xanthomonadaceae bacterium]|nr:ribbon-helix-helix protein, CopG family [Xanthomonadaceae bacterium]